MKILLTADPELPVPPKLYGGIERIVDMLVKEYVAYDHEVTILAHKDSATAGRLVSWRKENSKGVLNTLVNTATLAATVLAGGFDIIHSFSRLAYLMPVLSMGVPKIMSYQREPTLKQIKRAKGLARKGSLLFTGCSNYISHQIKPFAPATTVYNGVPIEKFDFSPVVAEDAALCFLGRIEPVKGTHIAIEVAQQAGRRLLIAGNIPKEGTEYFEEKIKPFLTSRIQYIGPVDDGQKNDLLRQSVAFLMPIQWNEPFGIVMAEAMACGTPVLGFPFGSVPEVVEPGKSGFICKDLAEMVEAVGRISDISRTEVRGCAETRFSEKKIAADYLELYTQMQGRNGFISELNIYN